MQHSISNIDTVSEALFKHINQVEPNCFRSARSIKIKKDDYNEVFLHKRKKFCPLIVEGGGWYTSWYLTHHGDKYYFMCISDNDISSISFEETDIIIINDSQNDDYIELQA